MFVFSTQINNIGIEHFGWAEGGLLIIGQTATGRATVAALRMNDPEHVNGRRIWIRAGYHPPLD